MITWEGIAAAGVEQLEDERAEALDVELGRVELLDGGRVVLVEVLVQELVDDRGLA